MDALTRKGLESFAACLMTRQDFDEAGEVLRRRWAQLAGEEVTRFCQGQRVNWHHGGSLHIGTVRRRNAKTLAVIEDGTGITWRISPSALTAESAVNSGA